MLVNIYGAKCIGIEAVQVTVEVDVTQGIGIHLVGLADMAVKESLLRTVTALQSRGFRIPGKKIVINLAPADVQKSGSGYDLPIALGIIAASGQRDLPGLGKYLIMGELGLDGTVRDVPGTLPTVELSIKKNFSGCIVPERSALEALEYSQTNIFGVRSLDDVIRIVSEEEDCSDLLVWNSDLCLQPGVTESETECEVDFADIIGQEGAKRGAEIAAAGGHNVIMIGPPGAGKSSLAKALTGILPPMTLEEAVITSKIYSVSGRSDSSCGLMRRRPFRSPHYSISLPALLGGGSGDNIMPGEVSLAENGVLFMDEFCETPKSIIEALRGPMEDRRVVISRLHSKVEYPASFMLVAASNPCPCGYYGEGTRCTCTVGQRLAYLARLSGPIMDRIDIHLWMHPVDPKKLVHRQKGESSALVAQRVLSARNIQLERFAGEGIFSNAEMSSRQIEKYCPLSKGCIDLLEHLIKNKGLSARAYTRIVKIARTIADLQGEKDISQENISEAAGYRFLDKQSLDD